MYHITTGCPKIVGTFLFQKKMRKIFLRVQINDVPGQFRLFFLFRTVEQLLSFRSRPNSKEQDEFVFRSQLSFGQNVWNFIGLTETQLIAEDVTVFFDRVWFWTKAKKLLYRTERKEKPELTRDVVYLDAQENFSHFFLKAKW